MICIATHTHVPINSSSTAVAFIRKYCRGSGNEFSWSTFGFAMLPYTISLIRESKCFDTMPEQGFYPGTEMLRFAFFQSHSLRRLLPNGIISLLYCHLFLSHPSIPFFPPSIHPSWMLITHVSQCGASAGAPCPPPVGSLTPTPCIRLARGGGKHPISIHCDEIVLMPHERRGNRLREGAGREEIC